MKRRYIAGKSMNTWFQFPPEVRHEYKNKLAETYGSICNKLHGCGKYLPLTMLSVDHIVPIHMGGTVSDINNMELLCFKCHKRKTRNELC